MSSCVGSWDSSGAMSTTSKILPLPVIQWRDALVRWLPTSERFNILTLSSAFWNNCDLAFTLTKVPGFHMFRLGSSLRDSHELCMMSLKYFCGSKEDFIVLLSSIVANFWDTDENCLLASRIGGEAYAFFPTKTASSEDFAWRVVYNLLPHYDNKEHLKYFPIDLMTKDKSFALACAQKCTGFLEKYTNWVEDKDFVLTMLAEQPGGIDLMDWDILVDRMSKCSWFTEDVILQMIRTNVSCATGLAPLILRPDTVISACDHINANNYAIHAFFSCLSWRAQKATFQSLAMRYNDPWILAQARVGVLNAEDEQDGIYPFIRNIVLDKVPDLLQVLPQHYQEDRRLAARCLSQNGRMLGKHLLHAIWSDDVEMVTLAVRNNGLALEYASKSLRNNLAVVYEAVKQNGMALAYASEMLRFRYNHCDSIVDVAVAQNPAAAHFETRLVTRYRAREYL